MEKLQLESCTGWAHTGQRTQALAWSGQAGWTPWWKAQRLWRCPSGLGTVQNRALCLLGKVPLGLPGRTGEGLRSAPAGGGQQQPAPAGGAPALGPDAGWVLGTHQDPPRPVVLLVWKAGGATHHAAVTLQPAPASL